MSDGVASPRWTPVSPVSGEIVPCVWKAPFEMPADEPGEPAPAAAEPPRAIEKPMLVERRRPPDDPGLPDDFGGPEMAARKSLAADG